MAAMDFGSRAFVRLSHRMAQWSASHMPRRRLRKWRYVSPRRHLIGLMILMSVFGLMYGYWALTNDATIRRMAGQYLHELTGAHVTVGEAHFDLFEGVRLGNVKAYISPDDRAPFFRAPEIILRHQPWSLLRGRLRVTEVVLMEPEVVNEYDVEADRYAYQALFARGGGAGLSGASLPTIIVQHALYRPVEVRNRVRAEGWVAIWDARFVPTGGNAYQVYLEEVAPGAETPTRGSLLLDTETGEIRSVQVITTTESIGRLLAGQFARWNEEYQIAGDLRVIGGVESETHGPIELELINVSLVLPAEQGGLAIGNARGSMTFVADEDGGYSGVVFNDVTGVIEQCGRAPFTLNGRADQVGEMLTFAMDIVIKGLSLPEADLASSQLGSMVDSVLAEFRPTGEMNVTMRAARDGDGRVAYSGTMQPLGMSMVYKHFPVPVREVTGTIRFDESGVHDINLSGLRDRGPVSVTGEAHRGARVWAYDVVVECGNAPFDDDTRQALPERYAPVWNGLNPEGSAAVHVHATRDDQGQRDLAVTIKLRGNAHINYDRFPYPLRDLFGDVSIESGRVHIDRAAPVTGGNGEMRCTIYGDIYDIGRPTAMADLSIGVRRLLLDDQLLAALPRRAVEVIDSIGLACYAPRVRARVVHTQGRPLDFNIQASVTDVAFSVGQVPLPVSKGAGEVTIEPARVIIKWLHAAHGLTPVDISGQVFVNDEDLGVDVSIDAPAVEIDDELLQLLPAEAQKLCRQFAPSGQLGMSMSLQRNLPGEAEGTGNYRLELRPEDMRVRYEGFPYPFRGVTGTIVVTPDGAELIELTAQDGDMWARIDGTIEYADGLRGRGLSLTVRNVPIDEELLAAVPQDLAALAERFAPGGECDMDISRLDFQQAARPEGDASDDAPPLLWYAEGAVSVTDAVVSLGLSDKSMSGRLIGMAGHNEVGLAIKGDLYFDSIHIGQRELTALQCRITKTYSSTMLYLDDFIGRTHGGRVSEGFAEIDLSDPLGYGIRLSVENVDLGDLLNAGITDPADRTDVTGLLTGRLELIAAADDINSRRASGMLLISQANIVRMPVLLGMMNVVTLQLPGNAMFTEGVISYRLNGNTLTFEEIHLTGPTLGIVGSGTMNMQTEQLNLTFLAGPPSDVPSLLGLDELVEHVVREIVEIQVTGTLSNPVTRTVPLRGLEDVVNRLLRPSEE